MLSGILVFNQKGENLIFRAFRNDCRPRLADVFRIQVISNAQVRSPILTLGSTTFSHVKHENIYLVAITKSNANAALVFEFLYRLIALGRGYFGKFEDETGGGGAVPGRHWEYQGLPTVQTVPAAQQVGPDQPLPPHWPLIPKSDLFQKDAGEISYQTEAQFCLSSTRGAASAAALRSAPRKILEAIVIAVQVKSMRMQRNRKAPRGAQAFYPSTGHRPRRNGGKAYCGESEERHFARNLGSGPRADSGGGLAPLRHGGGHPTAERGRWSTGV